MGESDNLEDVGYLQDIISYIFDEKKIVTYKWISNVLSIHVNRAKQLLYTFIKHISEERLKELKVTYLVGGILPNDKGCRLQVVSEDDLVNVKAQFKVITSEHIYSVSLKNCLTDLHNLCSVDGVKDCEVGRNGAVKCSKSISRTCQENASKRQGAYNTVEDDKKWPTAQTKQGKETPIGSNDKKVSKASTSNGLSAMFAAQNGKKKADDNSSSKKPDMQKGESREKPSPETKVASAKNGPKDGKPPGNRLAAMFSAQNSKPRTTKKDVQEENKSKIDKEDPEKDSKVPENNSKLDVKHEKKKTDTKNPQEKTSKTKTKSESKKSKQKKRKANDKEENSKKRKRIVMIEDSDSSGDDIFGSDNDEDEEEKSFSQLPPENEEVEEPSEEPAPKDPDPPELDANGHHARKRRLVDKTFMDEDGYMVTKKVFEYVSCGESESEGEKENEKASESVNNKTEIESKKIKTEKQQNSKTAQGPQKKSNPKKNSSPEKKKQATLMNFFKRS